MSRLGSLASLPGSSKSQLEQGLLSMSIRYWLRCTGYMPFLVLLLAGCAGSLSMPDPRVQLPHSAARTSVATGVILLQSDDSPAYAEVTREVVRQWKGDLEIVHLNDDGELSSDARALVQNSTKKLVIAVGLNAAREAARLSGKKIVFCQVFNHEEHDLVRPWMKGVSALAPIGKQFRAWKTLDPHLNNVAVIVGPGLRGLLSEAQAAAQENDIRLRYIKVNSDVELRYANSQLGPEVQGLWLVPDNRVLSGEVLREIFALSRSRGRQVLVTNPQLLSFGATLSAESDYADIAAQVLARLRESEGKRSVPGPDIAPLTKAVIKTAEDAHALGPSAVSSSLQSYVL